MQLQDITTCPVLRRILDLSACHSHTASPHHGRRTGRTNIIDRVHQRNPACLLAAAANCCCAALLGTTAQNPGNRASDIPYAPLLPSPKTLVLTPLNPPPPLILPTSKSPSSSPLPPPTGLNLPHLSCAVAQSNGLCMMCQRTSRPAHGRHSQDCGDSRGRGGERPPSSPGGESGVVCSDQCSTLQQTPNAARRPVAAAAAGESNQG